MKNWLRDLLISEFDQDPRFIALVRGILGISAIAAISIAISLTFVRTYSEYTLTINLVVAIAIAALFFLWLTFRGILWPGKLLFPIAVVIAVPLITINDQGLHDPAVTLLPVIVVISTLMIGKKILPWITAMTILGVVIIAYSDMAGITKSDIASTTGFENIATINFSVIVAAVALNSLMARFDHALEKSRENENAQIDANNELRNLQENLEHQISERTVELELTNQRFGQRARQFEAITLLGNAISSIRSLDELLPQITELICRQFDYYHAGIFLNDANNEYAVLHAANSDGGKRMLARGHQLRIGTEGIVGYVTNTGKARIALDVGADAVYFNNPDLPETRSEIALPLFVENTIVGALDVQSTEAEAFKEEDIDVLSLLANQVSLAIENARLFDQARKSLAESQALYRQYLRQAWNRLPKEQQLFGYRYNTRGSYPIENRPVKGALEDIDNNGKDQSRILIPINVRGETIGTLSVKIPENAIINNDQLDIANAVADRVALSAENARLFEETNRRAERERLVSDITVKIRSTNDPEEMIQIALDELKTALGATKVQLIPHEIKSSNRNIKSDLPSINSKTKNKSNNEQGEEE